MAQERAAAREQIRSARVLELEGPFGCFCGKMLADLGADVIKVEPPARPQRGQYGDPSRMIGPFYLDEEDPEKSLFWIAYNANKRGIALDLEDERGRALFRKLAATADFVIESYTPGYLDRIGIGHEALAAINPGLIMVSITPFGQSGPWRDYVGSDIVSVAAGGLMYLCGDLDRPPLRMGVAQAHCLAGSQAAVGALLAHYGRLATGKGRHVDVSVQETVVNSLTDAQMHWYVDKRLIRRGGRRLYGGRLVRTIWRCKDGHVAWQFQWGPPGANSMESFVRLLERYGVASELKDVKWGDLTGYTFTQEQLEAWEAKVGQFFAGRTKKELYDVARETRTWLFPVNTAKDVLESPQLAARGYFQAVKHPTLGISFTYPGAFFKSDKLALAVRRPPPRLGEHNEEVYLGELGLSPQELAELKEAGVV